MALTIQRPAIPVPLTLARGGTEATTAAGARTNLQLGDLALLTAPGGTTTFLRADKTWAVPAGGGGGGDVSSSVGLSVDSELAVFDGTSGKLLKRGTGSGLALLTNGVLGIKAAPTGAVVGTTDAQTLTGKTIAGASNTLTVREADLALSDLTTADVSTARHGLLPKAPGGTTLFFRADATWATPAGGGGGAPPDAEYITSTLNGTLSAERVLTDTATITWDRTTAGQIKANAIGGGGYTDEQAQDAVGAMLTNTSTVTLTYVDATPALNAAVNDASITETKLSLSDVTTQDASTTTHGLLRKLSGTATQYLDGSGAWTTPAGGGGTNYWSRVDLGASTLATGLLAYWHLEEATGNRLDAIGTNHLVPTGTTVQVTNAVGKNGYALAMNGTAGTYLSVADNATLSAGANQSFTLACWVYLTNTNDMGLVGKGSAAVSTNNVEYLLWHYLGQWHFVVGSGAGFVLLASPTTPVVGTWTLLMGWYDHVADIQYLQVNNGTPAQVANTAGSHDSTLPFEVGRTVGFASQSLNGRIDMIAFWKRVLTAQERTDYWNNGNGLAYPFAQPAQLTTATAGDQVLLALTALTQERLEVSSGIKIGTTTGLTDGIIRWTGADFEGRKAGAWVSMTAGAGGQPLDATLTALAGLATGADQLPYFTGTDTASQTPLTAAGRALLDDADNAAQRTTLGLGTLATLSSIGTTELTNDSVTYAKIQNVTDNRLLGRSAGSAGDVQELTVGTGLSLSAGVLSNTVSAGQPLDATLTALAGLATGADQVPYATGTDTFAQTTLTTFARTLLDDVDAPTARTTLGAAASATTQPLDATLTALAGLATGADQLPYATGTDTFAQTTLTTFARTLLDDTTQAAMRTTLALTPGTDVQAQDAELQAIAGLASVADRVPYFTGTGTAALATFTAAGRTLAGAADAAAQRTALALGTMAQQDAANVAITGGSAVLSAVGIQRAIIAGYDLATLGPVLVGNRLGVNALPDTYALAVGGDVFVSVRAGIGHIPQTGHMLWIDYQKGGVSGISIMPTDNDTGPFPAIGFYNVARTAVGQISTTATTTAYATSSDARLKHAIAPLLGALAVVQALRPVHFLWNANDEPGEGFLAHQLQVHVPAAVTGQPDEVHEDGSIKPQQVDHSRLVPWLTSALQEAVAQVQALSVRVQSLEEQLGV